MSFFLDAVKARLQHHDLGEYHGEHHGRASIVFNVRTPRICGSNKEIACIVVG